MSKRKAGETNLEEDNEPVVKKVKQEDDIKVKQETKEEDVKVKQEEEGKEERKTVTFTVGTPDEPFNKKTHVCRLLDPHLPKVLAKLTTTFIGCEETKTSFGRCPYDIVGYCPICQKGLCEFHISMYEGFDDEEIDEYQLDGCGECVYYCSFHTNEDETKTYTDIIGTLKPVEVIPDSSQCNNCGVMVCSNCSIICNGCPYQSGSCKKEEYVEDRIYCGPCSSAIIPQPNVFRSYQDNMFGPIRAEPHICEHCYKERNEFIDNVLQP